MIEMVHLWWLISFSQECAADEACQARHSLEQG